MPFDTPDAESAGRDREARPHRGAVPWDRFAIGAVLVLSPAVAASAVAGGASPAAAALLMVVMMGGGIAGVRFLGPSTRERPAWARHAGTADEHLDHLADRRPLSPMERQLSARYGVWVEQVAAHVWLVDGELIEAVLDEGTGRLMAGHRELSPRSHWQP